MAGLGAAGSTAQRRQPPTCRAPGSVVVSPALSNRPLRPSATDPSPLEDGGLVADVQQRVTGDDDIKRAIWEVALRGIADFKRHLPNEMERQKGRSWERRQAAGRAPGGVAELETTPALHTG